jgi:heparanase 1
VNITTIAALCLASAPLAAQTLTPATMPKVAEVSPRFQSYNVEMVEVTGGRFWKPFSAEVDALLDKPRPIGGQVGVDPALYEYRKPIDLSNPRLRKLAAALGPTYIRVSGSWQNSTFFQNTDAPAPANPPAGFRSVLTRAQWKGVIDFAHATDAQIVSSVATSDGTRDANGVWTPTNEAALLDYTKSIAGRIAATEFMNEPTFASMAGASSSYDAAAFARDLAVFIPFIRKTDPHIVILGPGGIGEVGNLVGGNMHLVSTESILKATGPVFDAFTYHFYGAVSQRCVQGKNDSHGISAGNALTADWLDRTDGTLAFYQKLRDQYDPGKPMWLNETAEAACGGDKLATTFLDIFRYLNQLGTLARQNVQVVAHNTLAASDYGLIDENTLTPRPNYWAALLWHRTMGTTVLDPGPSPGPSLRLYAHCTPKVPGGVTLLVLNTDRTAPQTITLPTAFATYTLTASSLDSKTVDLNSKPLAITPRENLPALTPTPHAKGPLTLAATTIAFVTLPTANNPACTKQ